MGPLASEVGGESLAVAEPLRPNLLDLTVGVSAFVRVEIYSEAQGLADLPSSGATHLRRASNTSFKDS